MIRASVGPSTAAGPPSRTRILPRLAAGPAGVAIALLLLALLVGIGAGVGWLVLRDAARSDQALATLLVGVPGAAAAFAAGGWVAARLAAPPGAGHAVLIGATTVLVALLALAAAADAFIGDAADFGSVRVALGLEEPVAGAGIRDRLPIPSPSAGRTSTSAPDLAWERTLDAIGYVTAVALLLVSAGALGALAGHDRGGASAGGTVTAPVRNRATAADDGGRPMVDSAQAALPWLILAAAALLLSAAAAGDGVLPGDLAVARWAQRAPDPPAALLARVVWWIGSLPAIVAAAALLVIVFVLLRRPAAAALVAAAAVLRAFNPVIKDALDSPRPTPDLVRVAESATGFGFPSGHAMGVTLIVGAVLLAARRPGLPPPVRRAVDAAGVVVLLVTGFGRVYSGAHWPSDVLGGYLWGFTLVLAAAWIGRGVHHRVRRRWGSGPSLSRGAPPA